MLKAILKLENAEILSKNEQKHISGGLNDVDFPREGFGGPCVTSNDCTATNKIPSICCSGTCIYTYNWQNAC